MVEQGQRSQAEELSTGERMGTYLGAAADGVVHEAKGEHETADGTREKVARADAEQIIDTWPDPPQRVARQMLDKYGPPNEATPTKLFWYHNGPWKVLAMNLVHELVTGKRTVSEARQTTAENTVAYSMGRNAPYAERLLFEVPDGSTEDVDESMISGAVVHQAAGKVKDMFTGGGEEATDRRTGADTRPPT